MRVCSGEGFVEDEASVSSIAQRMLLALAEGMGAEFERRRWQGR